ncbi:glutathione S-transferase family protein [Quisquiliibacterium transsilvanicum]|uniref:Glutathione S-transferase n=1 Tax=Quisquiliibacterium transsilvanicum TaxID=1549638 RepID=A0A7W8HKK7_9BURK|nr:glutathione S-transferase family protein [Quisquiliibacterium transsilvanicum]MBB5273797.1 glutathione S-transferase [Quisquiliibacterium transsilvanicum]
MITLHKFIPAWGLPDISPFCMKAETYLRMTGAEYKAVVSDSRKAPKGKCPYIEHEGQVISDSSMIIEYLESRSSHPLDSDLTAHERAISAALKAMLEEQFYFVIAWARWVDPAGWNIYRPVIKELGAALGVPKPFIPLLEPLIRAQMRRTVYLQGTGRHSPDEIRRIGVNVVTALSDWLEDKPYMLGTRPHLIDATAYAFIASWLWGPFEGAIKDQVSQRANLVRYCDRMKAQYWA